MCSHPVLGRSQALADFLSPNFSSRMDRTGRKGILAKIAEGWMGPASQRVPVHDIEDFFQNERDWSYNYSNQLKTVLGAVLNVIHAEKSNHPNRQMPISWFSLIVLLITVVLSCFICWCGSIITGLFLFLYTEITGQLKHLCTALSMNTPASHETGFVNQQLLSKMADSFLNIQV